MKRVIKVVSILIIFVFTFIFLNKLVSPKYQESLIEGSFTSDYYESSMNHDVIIIGDCEVYENISPMEIYQTNGIKSYVRGNSQQMMWQSFYILEETLKYEKPKAVILSVNALRNGVDMKNEAYNRLVLDKMKWSNSKVKMINESMTSKESFLSYVFPILRYHSRMSELNKEDFNYLFKSDVKSYNGFVINKGVKGVDELPTKRPMPSYDFDKKNIEYLDKIRKLCEDNDIKLILVKVPSLYPYWYDEYDKYVEDYASKYDLGFYNFLDYIEEIGIDYNEDTYDGGLHLNITGSSKFSKYLALMLEYDYNLKGDKQDKYFNELLDKYLKDIK